MQFSIYNPKIFSYLPLYFLYETAPVPFSIYNLLPFQPLANALAPRPSNNRARTDT